MDNEDIIVDSQDSYIYLYRFSLHNWLPDHGEILTAMVDETNDSYIPILHGNDIVGEVANKFVPSFLHFLRVGTIQIRILGGIIDNGRSWKVPVDYILHSKAEHVDRAYTELVLHKPHIPTCIPVTGMKKYPQKRCVICRKHGNSRDTRYCCQECDVALCKQGCFDEYHCM